MEAKDPTTNAFAAHLWKTMGEKLWICSGSHIAKTAAYFTRIDVPKKLKHMMEFLQISRSNHLGLREKLGVE